jgi:hypothetical protein
MNVNKLIKILFDLILSFDLVKDFWKWKIMLLKKALFHKWLSKDSYNRNKSWW